MQIKETIHQILNQLSAILNQLNDAEYAKPLPILNQQTIGKHTRHIVEFFLEIINDKNYVCYDERKRDLLLETSIIYTLDCITTIKHEILELDVNQSTHFKQLIDEETIKTNSSIGREMIYCIDHGIHHFAIIKIALQTSFPQVIINENFGIAYSTINHHKK